MTDNDLDARLAALAASWGRENTWKSLKLSFEFEWYRVEIVRDPSLPNFDQWSGGIGCRTLHTNFAPVNSWRPSELGRRAQDRGAHCAYRANPGRAA